jgi:hypothetical protein
MYFLWSNGGLALVLTAKREKLKRFFYYMLKSINKNLKMKKQSAYEEENVFLEVTLRKKSGTYELL